MNGTKARIFDEYLVASAKAGDCRAFEALVRRWQQKLGAHACRLPEHAERRSLWRFELCAGLVLVANTQGAQRRRLRTRDLAMKNVSHRAKIVYRGVEIDFIDGGYFCRIPLKHIAIDADGAPDAYGPPRFYGDRHGCGTDTLNHSGYPDNRFNTIPDDWRDILVADPHDRSRPLERDGYFISKTSLYDQAVESDIIPGKFVDANHVAYIVMPQFWIDHLGVSVGDLCLLWHARLKRRTVAIVADTCPVDEPLGEISIAAAWHLGGKNVSPLTGADFPCNGSIHCYIFKGSRPQLRWPLTNEFVQSFLANLEAKIR